MLQSRISGGVHAARRSSPSREKSCYVNESCDLCSDAYRISKFSKRLRDGVVANGMEVPRWIRLWTDEEREEKRSTRLAKGCSLRAEHEPNWHNEAATVEAASHAGHYSLNEN